MPSWKKLIGSTIFGILGTITLAKPVCAAVCPRGIGGCVYPGRCFLFTDMDSNSLCDYTRTAITQVTQTPVPVVDAPPVTPLVDAVQATQIVPDPVTYGFFNLVHISPVFIGVLLFLLVSAVLIYILKSGKTGVKLRSKGPLLATSSLFALGISEIIIYLLMEGTVPGMPFALVYMLAGVPLIAYLWKKESLDKPVALLVLVLSTTAGFVFLSPIMPMEFIGLVLLASGSGVLVPAIIAILVVLAISLLVGRVFCGHICPVGAVQELASFIPLKKIDIRDTRIPEIIRLTVFIAVVAGGVYLIDLMKYTGAYDFFSLALTAGFFIFAALLLLSVFLYRPVCRFLCPYGVLFSLLSYFSRYRLNRTSACINCRKCERVCPVHVAGAGVSKRECYLCGRCTETCPVEGAIRYEKP
ncbi:MAG: 4Fe-4S binding protein [Methanoregulaceae archaeon]|jgi:polyferredoxin|nr:4Fe-4S binding protein [Methanoregulaceae archaeon]